MLIRYPELSEYAECLTPELFVRPENREIFSNYLDIAAYASDSGGDDDGNAEDAPLGIREQIETLKMKSLPVMDLVKRRWAMAENAANLEHRYLKQLKKDEQDRFADSPDEVTEEDTRRAVELNQRIRDNEILRRDIRARR